MVMVKAAEPKMAADIGQALSGLKPYDLPAETVAPSDAKTVAPSGTKPAANSEISGSAALVAGFSGKVAALMGGIADIVSSIGKGLAAPSLGAPTQAAGAAAKPADEVKNSSNKDREEISELRRDALKELHKIDKDIVLADITPYMARQIANGELDPVKAAEMIKERKAKKEGTNKPEAAPAATSPAAAAPPAPQAAAPAPAAAQ